jgi:hypothetical protein
LSEQEKREMLEDAQNVNRREVFRAALIKSQGGSLDDYINFLSANWGLFDFSPSRRSTANFKL